jgi:hypothetical protein
MKDNKLYNVLDLIEEIAQVDKMIDLHKDGESYLMLDQYKSQKLKLSSYLFKELLSNTDNRPEVMYIIKKFIETVYKKEISQARFDKHDNLRRIEDFIENYR